MVNLPEQLFVDRLTSGYQYFWHTDEVCLRIERLSKNGHGGLWGEISVFKPANTPVISPARIDLLDRRHRIRDIEVKAKAAYRLHPIIPECQLTIAYGMGGSGKSVLACLLAVMIQDGIPLGHLTPVPGNVLYLDYEADRGTVKSRIDALRAYFRAGCDPDTDMRYRRSGLPMLEDYEAISDIVIREKIDTVIVDGFGYAIGGDTQKEDRVISTANIIRRLGVTVVVIDHEAKLAGSTGPYGSVYKYNAGRFIFHVESEKDGDILRLGLQNTKMNAGKLLAPPGIEFEFVNASNDTDQLIELKARLIDASTMLVMNEKLPRWQQIRGLLLSEGQLSVAEIASALEDNQHAVRSELSRNNKIFEKLLGKKGVLKVCNRKQRMNNFCNRKIQQMQKVDIPLQGHIHNNILPFSFKVGAGRV